MSGRGSIRWRRSITKLRHAAFVVFAYCVCLTGDGLRLTLECLPYTWFNFCRTLTHQMSGQLRRKTLVEALYPLSCNSSSFWICGQSVDIHITRIIRRPWETAGENASRARLWGTSCARLAVDLRRGRPPLYQWRAVISRDCLDRTNCRADVRQILDLEPTDANSHDPSRRRNR